jgi:hypothetical protein
MFSSSAIKQTVSATAMLVSYLCMTQGIPDKPIVIQMLKQFPAFMEPESP